MAAYLSPLLPLVGRDRELDTLAEQFAAALAGRGSLALIGGEAGIGKTALAEALCREAEQRGALVLIGRCYDRAETPPYGPFLELFRAYRREDDLPPAPFSHWPGTGDAESQEVIHERILGFFRDVARQCPLVLLLDDLHWADDASLALLRVLARSLSAWPVLVLATYRADELTRHHPLYTLLPALEREAPVMHVSPRPLDGEAIAALVRHRYSLPDGDAERLVVYLDQRSEGNPLFVAQLLRALEDRDILRPDGRGWKLDDLSGLGVPASLMQLIETRLARLDEGTRALLGMAAVVGQDVTLRLWAAAAGVAEDAVIAAAEAACATGLITMSEDGERARFMHALIRECVYEGIFPPRRRILHRHVAEVLAAVPAADPDAVAYHFRMASDARALEWLMRAGERAERAFALPSAAERYERALPLLADDDPLRGWLMYRIARARRYDNPRRGLAYLEGAAALAETSGDRALAAVARWGHGHLRCMIGEAHDGLEELVAGADAITALSPEERSRIAVGQGGIAVDRDAPHGIAVMWLAGDGQYPRALRLAERWLVPLAAADRPPQPAGLLADGWAGLGRAQAALGRPEDARAAFDRARAGYEQQGNHYQAAVNLFHLLVRVVLPYETERTAERGRLEQEIRTAFEQTDGIGADAVGLAALAPLRFVEGNWNDPGFTVIERDVASGGFGVFPSAGWGLPALGSMVQVMLEQGRSAHPREMVRHVLPGGAVTEPGLVAAEAALTSQRVAIRLFIDEGDLLTARRWLEAHDRWLAWSGTVLGQSEGHALWARYHRQTGDTAEAYRCGERARMHASDPRQPLALLAAHRLLGELETDVARYEKADAHLHAALALAEACAAPYERALTLLALATLRAAAGDTEAARTCCMEARAICASLGVRPALARIEALLATLGDPTATSPAYPAGLSAREVEVLCHLAAGQTNRAIAAALSLSEHTVRAHLRHIFAKTDCNNRAAAAAFALRHGLA